MKMTEVKSFPPWAGSLEAKKLKVKSCLKKLFTIHCSPPHPPLSKGGRWGGKKGFTLIETVMIIVIAAIAIPALLLVLGQETQQGVNAELMINATNVAQKLMEEVKSKCWDEFKTGAANCSGTGSPGALGTEGETRTACTGTSAIPFDDVDDYSNYPESCTWGGPSYTTTVEVCYVPASNLNDTSTCNTTTDYKRIKVTVTNTNLGSVELVTVVTNY
ncbi:MAG: hypothetical protein HY755_01545 [Nitrospirae bacterium]|nr:hypothetical protein [Nitrospirota bacterium]